MSFGAGMGVGIGAGIAIGMSSGRRQAVQEVRDLLESQSLTVYDAHGDPVDADSLLAAVPTGGTCGNASGAWLIAALLLAVTVGGVIIYLVAR